MSNLELSSAVKLFWCGQRLHGNDSGPDDSPQSFCKPMKLETKFVDQIHKKTAILPHDDAAGNVYVCLMLLISRTNLLAQALFNSVTDIASILTVHSMSGLQVLAKH